MGRAFFSLKTQFPPQLTAEIFGAVPQNTEENHGGND